MARGRPRRRQTPILMRTAAASPIARNIRVRGQVQGVGFRPFVHRLARELGISGWVRNDGEGVEISAHGDSHAVQALMLRLRTDAPPLARVDAVESRDASSEAAAGFAILESAGGPARTAVTPDAATCPLCLTELFDPADRRYRYPFVNCTDCGPRYTITRQLPYDRARTSMAAFELCPACGEEYRDPASRRFHAEPNACRVCGPRLALLDGAGEPVAEDDVVAAAVARLLGGEILALKGLGGFHLACDANDPHAVMRLRERKAREEKPFAVMSANPASLRELAEIGGGEESLLGSSQRPIVLLRKKPACDRLLAGIAPGVGWLGAMLPYTPLHYLLFHQAAGRPNGTAWLDRPQALLLVMTSANPHGEPLVIGNDEAVERLAGIADAFVTHDRDILLRCDDSVVRPAPEAPARPRFVRRARGFTPRAIPLAHAGPSVLACGGWFKNTVCLTRGSEAFVSQHLGDLDNASACRALEETVAHLMAVLEIRPETVAHDLHPDFHSTRFAAAFAAERGIPALTVQHHHAHVAAVLAEHRVAGPALGLALDGVGLGTDGAAWGGELLRVEGSRSERLGHLAPLGLPGGDRAAREPWRMAASALHALGRGGEIAARYPGAAGAAVRQMLERGLNAPPTSSCGRLFDAAAGLLGVKDTASFEGQAAMLLEGLAEAHGPAAPLAPGYLLDAAGGLDFRPLLARIADTADAAFGAALFHATVADGLAQWAARAARRSGIATVVLGGGCFLNAILSRSLRAALEQAGFTVLEACQVPPNDGGLSLGQAWVAMQRGT